MSGGDHDARVKGATCQVEAQICPAAATAANTKILIQKENSGTFILSPISFLKARCHPKRLGKFVNENLFFVFEAQYNPQNKHQARKWTIHYLSPALPLDKYWDTPILVKRH